MVAQPALSLSHSTKRDSKRSGEGELTQAECGETYSLQQKQEPELETRSIKRELWEGPNSAPIRSYRKGSLLVPKGGKKGQDMALVEASISTVFSDAHTAMATTTRSKEGEI